MLAIPNATTMNSSSNQQFQYSQMVKVMESSGDNSLGFEVVFRGEDDTNEVAGNEMQQSTSGM